MLLIFGVYAEEDARAWDDSKSTRSEHRIFSIRAWSDSAGEDNNLIVGGCFVTRLKLSWFRHSKGEDLHPRLALAFAKAKPKPHALVMIPNLNILCWG